MSWVSTYVWGSGETDTVKTANSLVQKLINELQDHEVKLKAATSALQEKDEAIELYKDKLRRASDHVKDLEDKLQKSEKSLSGIEEKYTTILRERDTTISRLKKKLKAANDVLDLEGELRIIGERLAAARNYVQDEDGPRPLVLAGPSGVGKGTLIKMLMEDFPGRFGFSVSHTTRKPRPGEEDTVHYFFVTPEDFEQLKPQMIEWANVHGRMYGTSTKAVQDVLSSGKICILDIDVQGCESVRKTDLRPVCVFVAPPSVDELEKRLRSRATESEEQIKERLRNASAELEASKKPGLFDFVLVNNDLGEAYSELKKIVEALL
eukprot:CAMPEP_0196654080 /NCGR_PEP_ID=MMETSP1086-20130531/3753_1 /TAXON_ID=77921 /ORGANISM="Cyanoptyche  gloeocystis , Strain SAG4.97" /LENGTH=321 /DNA_ID=CAMNT_0041985625 /DNA_START=66 /DNA_END=1031 /DNA_ORIENTATION=-